MPYAFRAIGGYTASSTGNLNLQMPAGVVQGDLLIAALNIRGTVIPVLPSDWTLCLPSTAGNVNADATGVAGYALAYCKRGASNPALACTRSGGDLVQAVVAAFSGGTDPTPFDKATGYKDTQSRNIFTMGGLTTGQDDELIIALGAGGDNGTWRSAVPANGPTLTQIAHASSTTGADGTIALWWGNRPTAGAIGNVTFEHSAPAWHGAVLAAFRAAPAGQVVTPPATKPIRRHNIIIS